MNFILSPAVLTDEFLVFVSFHEFIMTQLNDQLLVGLLALLVVERGTGIEDHAKDNVKNQIVSCAKLQHCSSSYFLVYFLDFYCTTMT